MEKKTVEQEKEYIPLLKYVMILTEKGINTSVEAVANGMAIGSIDVKRVDGKWYVAKHEMLKRIKASGKKLPPIEAGYYSIHGFIYNLSECGVDMYGDNICHLIATGRMEAKVDEYNRFVIPAHELEKIVKKFGK
jgi:hypothetical protein